jgi:hypothetical protein
VGRTRRSRSPSGSTCRPKAVPAFSPDKIAGLPDWNAVARTAELAPHDFLLYGKVDATPVMKLNGHTRRAVTDQGVS